MKKFALVALVVTMFAACTTDVTEDVAIDIPTPETLTGSFEENSRIQLQNGKTVWTKGDLVSVFYRSNANQQWQYQGETGERSGTLKLVADAEATQEISDIVVIYPYNENYFINTRTYNVQASLPAKQTYLANSYGLDGNIMISLSEYKNFSLKNVCGWLKIQLTGTSSQKVSSITLKGNNGEQVAGEIYINSADASCELAIESGGLGDDMEVEGSIFEDGTILTSVVLDCGTGVALSRTPKSFYIALPPQTFEKGLTIDIACTDGSTMTKSTESEVVITRNTIQPMAAVEVECEAAKPANNEIWYTNGSTTEATAPKKTDVFGANIVSNTYDATRQCWVLKFDGNITSIGYRAFYNCSSLTSVTIPDSVTSIGQEAFYDCSSLTSVTILDSVTSIGYTAFWGCSSLTAFYGKFASEDNRCLIVYGVLNSFAIGCGATEYTIPDSVTSIGNYAFENCSSLTSVTIPDSVTSIGGYAFYRCTGLTRVDITDLSAWYKISFGNGSANPCYYGAKLYLNGSELTEVTIPSDITEIKDYTFFGCKSLTSITIPDSVTSIGKAAFYNCSSLTSVTIPDSVTSIGGYAFRGCSSLTSITIPNIVTKIENSTFSGCSSLTTITIPDSVTSIGEYAFYDCSSLTSITIPNIVTKIENSTFSGCSSLTSVTIPDSVTSIGWYAFEDCSSLTSVTIPDSVTSIGEYAFYHCNSLTRVDISDLSAWCKIALDNYSSNPCCNGAKLYLNGSELTEVTIPSDITEIKDYAFYNCSSLTSVTIPDSVTSIGDYAFYRCSSLTSVTIGNSVTEIGDGAFRTCSSLTSVTIGDSVTKIGREAFDYCSSLTSVTIGNSVTEIGDYAFYRCSSLTSVTIPDSVTSIGGSAFSECSSLKEVYCKPTTPPTGGNRMFSYYNYDGSYGFYYPISCKIYVPTASVSAYKAKEYWSDYAKYIEPYEF